MTTLSDPLVLPCGATLPNRLAKSAMSERLADPGALASEALASLYRVWAAGGAGLLITGNIMVDPAHLAERGNVALGERDQGAALARWAEACSSVPTWVQINHPGRQAPRRLDPAPVAPSPIGLAGSMGTFAVPRELGDGEIEDIVARFASAAGRVKAAGFAGVQIHGAHGYLVSQFLSPRTNLRTDRWGGDLAGRSAFLLAVARAVRAEVGPGWPVGVKLNTADFQRGGFSVDDALEVAAMLEAERIDLLELSGGTYERAAMFDEPSRASTAAREAYFLDQAERVRQRVRTPLMLTGGFRTRAGMSGVLASGAVDVVGLARPLALEPDLCRRLLDGTAEQAAQVRLHTGLAQLDALLTGSWYQVQIERIASGRGADPGVWRASAIAWYVRDLLARPS